MCKKLVCLSVALLVAAPVAVSAASKGPVGWWKFDETSGTVAVDAVGARNGTLLPANANPPAKWVAGKFGGALQFDRAAGAGNTDATNPYVELPIGDLLSKLSNTTIAVWVNWGGTTYGSWQRIWDFGSGQITYAFLTANSGTSATSKPRYAIRTNNAGESTVTAPSSTNIADGNWHHIAVAVNATTMRNWLYVDGVAVANAATSFLPKDMGSTTQNWIARSQYPDAYYVGKVDDLRIYDRFLSGDDITSMMNNGIGYGTANTPAPANRATDVLRDQTLSWKAGPDAVAHDVYFGTDPANLQKVGTAQAETAFNPGRMEFSTTYYWRVDEIAADGTVCAGNPWSFKTEALMYKLAAASIKPTASSYVATSDPNKTINGSGLDANDLHGIDSKTMWLSESKAATPAWIQYTFDKVYKLSQMWVWNLNNEAEEELGYGFNNVTIEYSIDGLTWTKLGDYVFEQGTSLAGYAHNTTIDFDGIGAKMVKLTAQDNWGGTTKQFGLSEVRFYYLPAAAATPSPTNNATGQRPDVALSWRPGRDVATHNVYFGTDPNNLVLAAALPATGATAGFTPAGLQLDSVAYYWRVDEVNDAQVFPVVAGDAWKFTTAAFLTVDDMESYNDDIDGGTTIYQTWADGYLSNTNGSQVGYDKAPFAEKTFVAGGSQSLPIRYTNTAAEPISEATRTFTTPQDWTIGGITTLVLFIRGDANSIGAGKIYAKINDTQVDFTGTLPMSPVPLWTQWNIDLTKIKGLTSVKSLTIGISGVGASGILFVDNIRLYKTAPAVAVAADPGTKDLIAYYAMSNNVKDGSGNGNDGVLVGAPTYTSGLAAFGTALQFNGTTDAVDLGKKDVWNFKGSFSVSLWANIGAWGSGWAHVMMGNRGEDNLGWQIRRGAGTGICFTTRGMGNDDTTGSTPPLGQWVSITCVYDSAANMKYIYMNGLLNTTATTNVGAKLAATTHNTYIGARANSGNTAPESWFTGMLDEIRVFNRALTANEACYLAGGR